MDRSRTKASIASEEDHPRRCRRGDLAHRLIPAANAYTLRGYFRDNGTYVDNYQRGTPDGYCWNTMPSVDSEPAGPVLADPLAGSAIFPDAADLLPDARGPSEIRNEQPGGCLPRVGVRPNAILGPSAERRALVSREAPMARLDKCPAPLQHTHRLEPDNYGALSPLLLRG